MIKRKNLVAAYRRFFDTEDGRIILHDILRRGHVFRMARTNSHQDMAFVEGERNMALHILRMVDLSEKDIHGIVEGIKVYNVKGDNNE